MPDVPIESPLGYIGVVFLMAGALLVLAGLDVIRIDKVTIRRSRRTWVIG